MKVMAVVRTAAMTSNKLRKRPTISLARLVQVNFVVLLILSITVLLFQFDSFPAKKLAARQTAAAGLPRPPLLRQVEVISKAAAAIDNSNNNAVAAAAVAAAKPDKGKGDDNINLTVRRYEIKLERLKDNASGTIVMETYEDWAPLGARHFDKLVQARFYDQCGIFRVVPNFIIQFGIAAAPATQQEWKTDVLRDDPAVETNAYGTVTYAMAGKNTRTTQIFINTKLAGNTFLDRQGFAPFGKVMAGMEHVLAVNDEYNQLPNQNKIVQEGNAYLQHEFPNLSYVTSIRRIDDDTNVEGVAAEAR